MKFLLMTLLLLTLNIGNVEAGNIWADFYADAGHNTEDIQSMADSYYSLARAGVSLKPADFYVTYLQYGLYNATENQIGFYGVGVKKGFVLRNVFVEPFLDFHRDPKFNTNTFRVGFYTAWTIKEW